MNWRILIKFSVIITMSSTPALGQNRTNNWIFGDFELNFNGGSPTVSRNLNQRLNRGIGSISDENGVLLFYSDGPSAWNRNHQLMPNGADLLGGAGSNSGTQESMVIPKPGSSTLYYVFTTTPGTGLYYSIVDMSLDSGLGDVIQKGRKLIDDTDNRISGVTHENDQDIWLMLHSNNTNKYYLLEITESGISGNIVEKELGSAFNDNDGQIKFSPDGKKVAVSYNSSGSEVLVFDFSTSSGEMNNPKIHSFEEDINTPILRGVGFSSDATKLYVSENRTDALYQFDLNKETTAGTLPVPNRIKQNFNHNSPRDMQLGTDGKIYITKGGGGGGTEHLGVISNPNARWDDVTVSENGLFLNGGSSFVARTPNLIQDPLYKTSFLVDGKCQDSPIQFILTNDYLVDRVEWSFGEGGATNETNPVYQYSEPGTYEVKLTVYSGDVSQVISQQIKILPYTSVSLGEDRSVCYGNKITVDNIYASYLWSTGDTTNFIRVFVEGNYSLTVENENGCSYTDSVYLTINDLPAIELPDSVQIGDSPIDLNPGEFNSYEWHTGETTASLTISEPGWYSVLVRNASGCQAAKSVYAYEEKPVDVEEGDWERLNPNPSVLNGKDVYFINDLIGFVLNDEQLIRTRDGGKTWKELMSIPAGNRIEFHNLIGYIVGDNGTIYRSTHNGEGWNPLQFEFTDHLNAISIINQDTLIVTGDRKVFRSEDAGKTWVSYDVPNIDIEDSFFQTDKIGHVAGLNGVIQKTQDGGQTWYPTEITGLVPSDFFRIVFVNDSLGFATQEHSDLYFTTDGGESWAEKSGLPEAGYDITFVNEETGFIVGDHGSIQKISFSPLTLESVSGNVSGYRRNLYGVSFVDQNIGFATGQFGRIIKTSNGGQTWTTYAPTHGKIDQVQVVSDSVGYALRGYDIYKTDDHGVSWKQLSIPSGVGFTYPIDFVSEEIGYAIGRSGNSNSVYKTKDGGLTWLRAHARESLLGENLYALDFISENVGFVSGGFNSNVILKTVNGGQSWSQVGNVTLGEIQFINETTGFGRTRGLSRNSIYKTTDTGENWQKIFEIEEDITALDFVNDSEGYFVGDEALMYKTTDGGASWTELEIPYDDYLDVEFYSNNIGYLLDESKRLYKTLDGGINWKLITNDYWVQSISLFEREIYIAGEGGNILRSYVKDSDLVDFAPLELVRKRMNVATLSSSAQSNLDTTTIYFEYGEAPGAFDVSEVRYQFSGITSRALFPNIEGLQDSTWYYARLRATDGTHEVISNTIRFRTKGYSELIDLGQISLVEAMGTSAIVESDIFSELENTPLHFEIRTESGVYSSPILLETYTTDIDFTVRYDISDLESLTTYFCRFKIINGDRITNGPEFSFTTELVTSIDDPSATNKITVYPNPTSGLVRISGIISAKGADYTLVDLQGKMVQRGSVINSSVDISNLIPGTYILNIIIDHQIFTRKIFKK